MELLITPGGVIKAKHLLSLSRRNLWMFRNISIITWAWPISY